MADAPFRFALLGAGMVADFHRRAIAAAGDDGACLAAVAHHDPARFDSIARRFGAPCITPEALWKRTDIDAVILCTPSGRHAEEALAAAEAGKHILVEKPMALTTDDADRMIAAADRAGVVLGVVLQRRAEPLFRSVYEAIRAGVLGPLTLGLVTLPYFRGQTYYDSAAWRGTWELDGGGILMNQGIHLIDLLVWYMGDPVAIQAMGETRFRQVEVEDVAGAVLRFGSGALATITATTTAEPGFPHRLEVYGARGGIQIEGETVEKWTTVRPEDARVAPPRAGKATDAGSGGDPAAIPVSGHTAIIRDFVDAVRRGRAPMVDGAEGRRSLAAVKAIYEAAGLG